MLDNTSN